MKKQIYLLLLFQLLADLLFCQNMEIVWQACYGGNQIDWIDDIIETNDGGYFILGTTYSGNGDVMNNHLDYYMYNAWESIGISDDTLCVEWPEMNIYYSYLKYWLYNKMMDSLISVNSWSYHPAQVINMIGEHNGLLGWYYHRGWFLFGHPWYSDEWEGPEEL
jgi:hypothetical protein